MFIWKWSPLYLLFSLYKRFRVASAKRKAYKSLTEDKQSIDPYNLVRIQDPLRPEAAPYTGPYFCYLKHKGEIPSTCSSMMAYGSLTQLTVLDGQDGWKVQDQSADLTVKVKVFTVTVMGEDGLTRMAG